MDNYFTSFCLFVCLPKLELINSSKRLFNKSRLHKYTIIRDKQLNSAVQIKQKCCVACVAGKSDKRALYIASCKSYQLNRNLFDVGTKLKESTFKSNNQINFTVTTRTWILSKEFVRTWPNTGLVSNETLFQWQMLFFRVCGCCIELTKIKAMSLCLCQCNFSGIFEGRQVIPKPYRNSKYHVRRLLWWHKTLLDAIWAQAYSEPLKASQMESFCANS